MMLNYGQNRYQSPKLVRVGSGWSIYFSVADLVRIRLAPVDSSFGSISDEVLTVVGWYKINYFKDSGFKKRPFNFN